MTKESFGFLVVNDCNLSGEIHFELYGEKRVEKISSISKLGIPFPVAGNSSHYLYFQQAEKRSKLKLILSFESGRTTQKSLRPHLTGA